MTRKPLSYHEYPREALEAVAALMAIGVPAHCIAIAGGYCRDIVHGEKPKDIDIIVGRFDGLVTDGLLMRALPREWCLQSVHSDEYEGEVENDFAERWSNVFQFSTGEGRMDVDFLVPTGQYPTCLAAARMNDYNLNQYLVYAKDVVAGVAPHYCGKAPEGTLTRTSTTKVSPERVSRMHFKAKMFGWCIPEVVV